MKSLFPIFSAHPELIFLDSSASAQKPKVVLDTVRNVHETSYANIHRGLYSLSLEATRLYDNARKKVASFFGVDPEELVFTKNGTEAANLFAFSWGTHFLRRGDEIVLTIAEHHANLVPWLRLRNEKGVVLKFVYPDTNAVFSSSDFQQQISPKTKLIAFPHVSNVTGQIFPVSEIVRLARQAGALTFLDLCQSAPKLSISIKKLDVDAAFFTGHKMGATGGTGGLYCAKSLLDQLPAFLLGGDMVDTVSTDGFTTLKPPQKFEAGTPAVAETIGLGAACEFLQQQGMEMIRNHDQELIRYGLDIFDKELPQIRIIGPHSPQQRCGLMAFSHPQIHPHDLAQFLDSKHICVRSGLHCAEPIHRFLELNNGSVRASFWVYNEKEDIEKLVLGIQEAETVFL